MQHRSQALMYERALRIKKSLGVRTAARYLYLRGVSIETARYLLAIKGG